MKIKIRIERKTDFLKIFINELLHVQFRVDKFVGLQSWHEGNEIFHVRYYMKEGKIDTYYYKKEIWKEILDQINKISLV